MIKELELFGVRHLHHILVHMCFSEDNQKSGRHEARLTLEVTEYYVFAGFSFATRPTNSFAVCIYHPAAEPLNLVTTLTKPTKYIFCERENSATTHTVLEQACSKFIFHPSCSMSAAWASLVDVLLHSIAQLVGGWKRTV